MSHSRIFQYSTNPIDQEDYIDESDFYDDTANGQSFHGEYCGDYTDDRNDEERLEDIKRLAKRLSDFNIKLEGEDKFVLGEGFRNAIRDFWYSRIKECFLSLDEDNLVWHQEMRHLKYAVTDPLCGGFGFLFYDKEQLTLSASGDFFEFLLGLKEGDSFYIGATLDYHC